MSEKSTYKTTSNYYIETPVIQNVAVIDVVESFPVDTGLKDVYGNYILKIPSAQREVGFLADHSEKPATYVSAK